MFAIALIHKSGGSRTVTGKRLQECRDNCAAIAEKTKHNYLACTIPYAVFRVGESACYDVTTPFEIKQGIGTELRLLLSEGD